MSPKSAISAEEKTRLIITALEDKKAVDPVVIDVRGRTVMMEFLVVASGTSKIQIRALAEGVISKLGDHGVKNKKVAGTEEGVWVLLDYGDVVVHLLSPEQRDFYRLEAYWSGAEKGSPAKLSPDEAL